MLGFLLIQFDLVDTPLQVQRLQVERFVKEYLNDSYFSGHCLTNNSTAQRSFLRTDIIVLCFFFSVTLLCTALYGIIKTYFSGQQSLSYELLYFFRAIFSRRQQSIYYFIRPFSTCCHVSRYSMESVIILFNLSKSPAICSSCFLISQGVDS